MTENKIITKPFKHGDEISKSRKLTGIDKWARSSPAIGVIMLILSWFTIPFEVIFRRDFGQRWFTAVNFGSGLLLICLFSGLQGAYDGLSHKLHDLLAWLGPVNPVRENYDAISDYSQNYNFIAVLGFLYLSMGLYHLFKIKWRNQANIPLHSFDDGTSRLGWIARIYMWIFNILAMPFLAIYWLLIPHSQRRGKPFPKLITDQQAFTNVVFEPLVVFIFAWGLTSVTSFWLFLSGFAMLIHGHWKEMARKTKSLDFQDSRIEAEIMREFRKGTMHDKEQVTQTKKSPKATQEKIQQVAIRYPSLSVIIEEMNRDKIHLSN